MLTIKDKDNILAALDIIDVKKMEIEHVDERAVKWFRFGAYTGISLAKEVVRQLPEKKKKELTKKVS